MVVALTTVTPVAAVPPKVTAVAPARLPPVIVTNVLPNIVPLVGAIAITMGKFGPPQFPMAPIGWADAIPWRSVSNNAATRIRTDSRSRPQEDWNHTLMFLVKVNRVNDGRRKTSVFWLRFANFATPIQIPPAAIRNSSDDFQKT
jgi:hypothetical protein